MRYKVMVYVPVADADKIRKIMGEVGAGKMGNYDFCSFSIRGTGRFRPLKGANPSIGEVGKYEEVEEERIEVVADETILKKLLEEIIKNHPYEEPSIDVMELQ